jgi:Flp pilus assembly protein TadG
MVNRSDVKQHTSLAGSRIGRGQTAVEFAMVATLVLTVMLVGVQFAMIGQAALALSQGASAIARYVAVNEASGLVSPTFSGNPTTAMKNLLSPSILTNSGGDLTITVNSYKGGTTSTAATTPVATVDRAVVTLSYDATNKIFLPTNTLLGISFPTALTASDQQLYE